MDGLLLWSNEVAGLLVGPLYTDLLGESLDCHWYSYSVQFFFGNTLTMNSSTVPYLTDLHVDQLTSLSSEDVILEGLSSLKRQKCEGSINWCQYNMNLEYNIAFSSVL